MNTLKAVAVGLALMGLVSTSARADLFVSTGQSNANVQLDVAHTQHWTYTLSSDVSGIDGGLFTMKRGTSTSADITFVIFQGEYQNFLDNNYTALFSKTLSSSSFSQSYNEVMFQDAAFNLVAGQTYTGVLYSSTPDAGSTQYFIKGDVTTLQFVNGAGDAVSTGSTFDMNPTTTTTTRVIPEPASLAMLLSGAALMLAMRRRPALRTLPC